MEIKVRCACSYRPERQYVCRVMLREFLGLEFILVYEDRSDWCITGGKGKELLLPDILFQTPTQQWLTPASLPLPPLASWDIEPANIECPLIDKKIPIIYGDPDFSEQLQGRSLESNTCAALPLDIFGSAFFMLTRYEELVKKERDEHGRFPAWASLALQEGFLDRPIVNEYLEIFWASMKKLWPGLRRRERTFQMMVTCDVDQVYQEGLKTPLRQIKTIGGDLLRRKNPGLALQSAVNYLAAGCGSYRFDPFLSGIDWIMDVNEKAGNRVAFYFKAGRSDPMFDSRYSLDELVVRKLLRAIHERGHEIGLHPSYGTFQNPKLLKSEADNMRRVLAEEGVHQEILGSRQHYLRWDSSQTPAILEEAGIDYDSTLTFADHAGFRCGTCYEYPFYDLLQRRELNLPEQPLTAMEGSVFGACYQNLTPRAGSDFIINLKQTTIMFAGTFALLWHNSTFREDKYFYRFYSRIVFGHENKLGGA